MYIDALKARNSLNIKFECFNNKMGLKVWNARARGIWYSVKPQQGGTFDRKAGNIVGNLTKIFSKKSNAPGFTQ